MSTQTLQKSVADLLAPAGVTLNGPNPWDLQIRNDGFYKRILSEGTLGLGESYMDGWWDCKELDVFAYRVLRADLYKKARFGFSTKMEILSAKIFNKQSKEKAANNAMRSYDKI